MCALGVDIDLWKHNGTESMKRSRPTSEIRTYHHACRTPDDMVVESACASRAFVYSVAKGGNILKMDGSLESQRLTCVESL